MRFAPALGGFLFVPSGRDGREPDKLKEGDTHD